MTAEGIDKLDIMIGAHIRGHRASRGLSQRDLANAAGISANRLQQYEAGVVPISAVRLYRLSIILDVGIGTFFEEKTNAPSIIVRTDPKQNTPALAGHLPANIPDAPL